MSWATLATVMTLIHITQTVAKLLHFSMFLKPSSKVKKTHSTHPELIIVKVRHCFAVFCL